MQISGLITSTRFTLPAVTMSRATLMPNVADEQATFMSNAKPFVPSASCTSTETAGYARWRLEQATMTALISSGFTFACASASCAAARAISHWIECSSFVRSGSRGAMIAGSRMPARSIA